LSAGSLGFNDGTTWQDAEEGKPSIPFAIQFFVSEISSVPLMMELPVQFSK